MFLLYRSQPENILYLLLQLVSWHFLSRVLYVCVQILCSTGTWRGKWNPEESSRKESKRNQKIHSGCDIGRDQERGTISEEEATEQRVIGINAVYAGRTKVHINDVIDRNCFIVWLKKWLIVCSKLVERTLFTSLQVV